MGKNKKSKNQIASFFSELLKTTKISYELDADKKHSLSVNIDDGSDMCADVELEQSLEKSGSAPVIKINLGKQDNK